MQQWISKFFDTIFSAISNFSDWLDRLMLPRMDDDDGRPPGAFKRAMAWPRRAVTVLVVIIAKILLYPIQLAATIAKASFSEWALCLPAFLAVCLAVFAMLRVHWFGDDIINRYRRATAMAMNTEDWELAKTYLGRIVNEGGDVTDADRLQWAMALDQTGSPNQASEVMDALAPESRPGSPLGHRMKALTLAGQIGQTDKLDTLERLHWHLKNAGKPDGWELNLAWATYHINLKEPEIAVGYLKAAAQFKPEHWLTIAELHRHDGNAVDERFALQEAAAVFERKVTIAPSDVRSRVNWANALSRLEQVDRAEQVLLKGLKLNADPFIRHATADFYLMRHDLTAIDDPDNFQQQFEYLKHAIDLDVNYGKSYDRLVAQFVSRPNDEDSQRIRGLIESLIADGNTTGLAHFTLANILWLSNDREEAQWHMEQAYKTDKRLVVVANNLAWLLAHTDPPDLDRALTLARNAVAENPDPRFRDTLGTVLMKQGNYEEALTEFENALKTTDSKSPIHEKLAFVYEQLGKPRLAELHRNNAKK